MTHRCCGCGGLCDYGMPCPMSFYPYKAATDDARYDADELGLDPEEDDER